MTGTSQPRVVLFAGASAGEVASSLFEDYVTAGWRVVGQAVVAEEGGRMDVRVTLEWEVAR